MIDEIGKFRGTSFFAVFDMSERQKKKLLGNVSAFELTIDKAVLAVFVATPQLGIKSNGGAQTLEETRFRRSV